MNEILKDYIGDVDLTNYNYLRIDFSDEKCGPGLFDQSFQLKVYLKIAYELGLILILPKRNLAKKHNNGMQIPLVFSQYYDINSIKVDGVVVNVVTSISESSCDEVLQINSIKRTMECNGYAKLSQELSYEVTIEPCKGDVEFARKFVKLNKIEGCVHVRRGDRCNAGHINWGISGRNWDIANCPKNILSMLDATNAPRNIYIMTDVPPDDHIIKKMKSNKKYNFMFLYDFPKLVNVKQQNNYKVFNMENCIMEFVEYKKLKNEIVRFWIKNKIKHK